MKEMMKAMQNMGKDGKKMNPMDKKAKMDVLKDLSNQAGQAMMIKISADSKEGLKEGLEAAKSKLDSMPEGDMGEEYSEEGEEYTEDGEEYEDSDSLLGKYDDSVEDFSNINPDELDAEIDKLLKMKEKMKTATMKL